MKPPDGQEAGFGPGAGKQVALEGEREAHVPLLQYTLLSQDTFHHAFPYSHSSWG
jgi:hypothetical protein